MVIVFVTFDRLTTKPITECSLEDFKNIRLHRMIVSSEDSESVWKETKHLRMSSPNGWCWWRAPPVDEEDYLHRGIFGNQRRRLPW